MSKFCDFSSGYAFRGIRRIEKYFIHTTNSDERKKKRKNYHDYRYLRYKANDMTYILGARCSDGVVLVGDTKVTIEEGSDYTYSKKITAPLNTVVMASAGISGLYKDFQNRIITVVERMIREQKEEGIEDPVIITREEEFFVLVNKVIREMHRDYDVDRHIIFNNLMVLCATRIGSTEGELTLFNPYGFSESINTVKAIGHGEPYGNLFLKNMWSEGMTMEQTAKLGVFIIKFIQDMKLDNSVGYSDDYLPQIYYIPDVIYPNIRGEDYTHEELQELTLDYHFNKYPIEELPDDEVLDFVNEVGSKIKDFKDLFRSGQFKI